MTQDEQEFNMSIAWRKEWHDNYPGAETSITAHKKGFRSGYAAGIEAERARSKVLIEALLESNPLGEYGRRVREIVKQYRGEG